VVSSEQARTDIFQRSLDEDRTETIFADTDSLFLRQCRLVPYKYRTGSILFSTTKGDDVWMRHTDLTYSAGLEGGSARSDPILIQDHNHSA